MYSEVQKFRQWWLIAIMALVISVPSYIAFTNGIEEKRGALLIMGLTLFAPVIVFIMFLVLKLETHIDEKGISYRFNLFHFKTKFISWDEVKTAYVRKYSPIRDYGGWGIRYNWMRSDRAFNVSGNIGLQLILKAGKKILLGTNQKDELLLALINLKNKYKIEQIDSTFHSS